MCQAYEAERSFIIAGENQASIEGFKAAREDKPKSDNPYFWSKYYREAWDHGWECWHHNLLPWALEIKIPLKTSDDYKKRDETIENFKRTKQLPKFLEDILASA